MMKENQEDGSSQPNDVKALSARVHTLSGHEALALAGTTMEGLSAREAAERLVQFGPNAIKRNRSSSLFVKLLANFVHLMAILLWVGGLVAFLAQMPELGIAIWLVNLLNGLFSFWQEFQAERATEALQKLLPRQATVIRDGREQRVPAEDLTPGDVMMIVAGEPVSADGRLIKVVELQIDQSVLTGESHPVRKSSDPVTKTDLNRVEMPNLVFAGTYVASGTGTAVVVATGMDTEFGRIASLTQQLGDDMSPLQKEMKVVTSVITAIALIVGSVCFALAVLFTKMNTTDGFLFALGMIVAFVPEGLLPTVTLALAVGVQRMARRNALVKRLSSVETLGCATVICTDKTGTLTQNEMTVGAVWLAGRRVTVTGAGYLPEGTFLEDERPINPILDSDLHQLLVAGALCNDARLTAPVGDETAWRILGDPTEAALLVVCAKAGIVLETEARRNPRVWELAFDSNRKRMSTLHRDTTSGSSNTLVALTKGAPVELLNCCVTIRVGAVDVPLDESWRNNLLTVIDGYARDGLRVLAICQRSLPIAAVSRIDFSAFTNETVERDLTLLGLVAMRDPPRPEVAEAARRCREAGVRTIMITGDYGLTAETIARQAGLIKESHPRICVGSELDRMDDQALETILQGEVLFARVAPEHKLRVVRVLQGCGHVVAVTGDGVNDAPALKQADIGVAMGLSGTDVAKEAADMVLTDDNFASIVNAIEEGRAVYANVKKFTSYIFTSNTPEAVPFILFALSGGRIPLALTIMQILAVDLGTDMVPALALGAEKPEPGIMTRPPRDPKEHIITGRMLLRVYPWLGLLQSAAAMAAFYFQYWMNGYWGQWLDLPSDGALYQSATTMTLAAVVTTQIGNLFAQRTDRASVFGIGFFTNRLMWIGITTELVLILVLTYVPFFQNLFRTSAFDVSNWMFLFALAPLLFLADELRKAVVRWMERRKIRVTMQRS